MKRKSCLVARVLCLTSTLVPFGSRPSVSAGQDPAADAGAKTVCTLSDEQETAAPRAFAVMTPTFQHPRCMNCHGDVNPFTGQNHLGGVIPVGTRIENGQEIPLKFGKCAGCHSITPGDWTTPSSELFFKGKDTVQLCKQMKTTLPDESAFIAHITEDRGGTPFIQTAFEGTAGLNYRGETKIPQGHGQG
jgi:hypothetical protein